MPTKSSSTLSGLVSQWIDVTFQDKLETVRKLMQEGRFEAGGFFTGPWELTSGAEALVRQLYFGKLWVKTTLGINPQMVWNVDVAGHTAQLPQILRAIASKRKRFRQPPVSRTRS